MQREGQFCPAAIQGARALVATWSQSSGPRLGLQGRGSRVVGAFPRRSARGWGLGSPRGLACVPARCRPSHRESHAARVRGGSVRKEEEGSIGRLLVGSHLAVREAEGKRLVGWVGPR
jgi:hypothetical protein